LKKVKVAHTQLPELIPVLGNQPAGDVNHKLDGRLPLLSARPAVTPATLKRAATNILLLGDSGTIFRKLAYDISKKHLAHFKSLS